MTRRFVFISSSLDFDSLRLVVQPTLYALWRSFTQCTFIEPEGDVVFFKNQQGESGRVVHEESENKEVRVEKEVGQGLSDVEEEDEGSKKTD